MTNILGSLWKKGIDSSLATSCRHGAMLGRGELGIGGSTFSRCGWKGILFTVIPEMPGICFLREVWRPVSRRKKKYRYHWFYETGLAKKWDTIADETRFYLAGVLDPGELVLMVVSRSWYRCIRNDLQYKLRELYRFTSWCYSKMLLL